MHENPSDRIATGEAIAGVAEKVRPAEELRGTSPGTTWQGLLLRPLRAVRSVWPRRRALAGWAIPLAILLAAAPLRFVGIDWDSGQHLHPDERFITMVSTGIELPQNLAQYFDTARSPLNPYNRNFGSFIYGTGPLFFVRALAEGIEQMSEGLQVSPGTWLAGLLPHLRDAAGYGNLNLLGRVLSGVADLATLLLIYLSGVRLGGRLLGSLAAVLSGLAVLQIQSAHFFTAESPLILFTTLAFYLSLRVARSGSLVDWALLGLATGLAVTTKLTAGLALLLWFCAAVLLWQRFVKGAQQYGSAVGDRRGFFTEAPPGPGDIVTGIIAASVMALLTFRIAQPYAFAGPGFFDFAPNPKYLADLDSWQKIATGQIDYPPSIQWTGSTPYVWQLVQMTLWGLGPPLALAAWAGFALALVQFIREPARNALYALGLFWVAANFLYWGPQFAKPMRYLLPIYPQLCLFAALALMAFWRWARRGTFWRQAAPVWLKAALPWTVPSLVVAYSAFYALAFASIYTRPTTRVAASEWIYTNVSPGGGMAWEHWDDPLPLRLPGRDSSLYPGIDLPLYGEDVPEKREQLITKLDSARYIMLSSNRLYGSIPKLPQRYPMTVRYYEALFSGELGFERTAEFTSRPSLLGIELNDDDAEEIFTVYEHPKVTIFRKGQDYASDRTRLILESVSLDNVVRGLKPIHARSNGLLLTPEERAAAANGGTWSEMFNPDSAANAVPLLAWYLTVQLLGIIAFPLVWYVCRGLTDRGYALAKTVGLLAIAYIPWLLASLYLVPYTRAGILLALLLLALTSGAIGWQRRSELIEFLRAQRSLIAVVEGLFVAVFVAFVAIRATNPDLWHSTYGGEKPMDFAYLNAVIRTTWFPPPDPWLAGGYINYYYFGFVIVASLIKLTGVVPWVAYNLALPTLAALTATSAAGIAYSLLIHRPHSPLRRRGWALGGGLLAAVLTVGSGNLQSAVQIFEWLNRLGGDQIPSVLPGVGGALGAIRGLVTLPERALSGQLPSFQFDFWAPTRVISTEPVTPITEFPYFTFLYGDLHAHMIAMPVALLAVALALNITKAPFTFPRIRGADPLHATKVIVRALGSPAGLTVIAAGAGIGILRMTNTWDFPTYLGIFVVALVLGQYLAARQWKIALAQAGAIALGTALVSQLTVMPFLARYVQFYAGVELSKLHTSLPHYLTVSGIFLAVVASYLLFRWSGARSLFATSAVAAAGAVGGAAAFHAPATGPSDQRAPWTTGAFLVAGVCGLAVAALFTLLGMPGVSVALVLLLLGIPFGLRGSEATSTRFMLLLAGTAIALTAVVEVVVLKGDIGRMNTVFKLYSQAWLLFSIAAAVMATLLARRAWGSRWLVRGVRGFTAGGLAVLLGLSLLYPLLGTPARLQHRFVATGPTLDGLAYMEKARYEDRNRDLVLGDDYRAIRWLLGNVVGTPVIAEGTAPLYHWGSRVSINTGLPTIVGWDWHQKQQRGDFAYMVDDRIRDVGNLYNSSSADEALRILRRYRVELVYIGGLEKVFYSAEGLAKFEQLVGRGLQRVYQQGGVTIYQVQA
ncbi:MAG: glycosyltransferase family 39 protein [Chloroflexi bacterium]|nr:glycosyltransferase family 39 protein [Chloroflexota bacterium]